MKKSAHLASVAFLASILLANYLTTRYGFVPVGFGLSATAGTFAAGFALAFRDAIQETGGRRRVVLLIAAGGVLSYAISDPFIAVASAVAFAVSETLDFVVYTPLRDRSWTGAVVASNFVGAIADTVIFLTIAGFPVLAAIPGQLVGKAWATAIFLVVAAGLSKRRAVA